MFFSTKKPPAKGVIASAGKSAISLIASDMHILGNIVSDGVIDIAGSVDGNLKAAAVTIRHEASVRGDITVERADIHGKIYGTLRARHARLFAGCHVEGIVLHETLFMEDGAFLDGKCKRLDKTSLPPQEAAVAAALPELPAPYEEEEEEESSAAELNLLQGLRLVR